MKQDLDRALAFITKKGCVRTDAVAAHLNIGGAETDALLQPAVESGQLVTCRILRPGKPDAFDYRLSEAVSAGAKPPAFVTAFRIINNLRIRRPLLAPPPRTPENRPIEPPKKEFPMSKTKHSITAQQVVDAIRAAGAAGINRKDLAKQLGASTGSIDVHICSMMKRSPVPIFKPAPGVFVAIEHRVTRSEPPADQTGALPKAKRLAHASREQIMEHLASLNGDATTSNALAEKIGCDHESVKAVLLGLYSGLKVDRKALAEGYAWFIPQPIEAKGIFVADDPAQETRFDPEPAACDQQTAESETQPALTVTHESQIDMTPGAEERLAPGGELSVPSKAQVGALEAVIKDLGGFPEDIVLDDADSVEFAVYSSGGLDIYCEDCAITLQKPVLAKLRAFLGLFREETA